MTLCLDPTKWTKRMWAWASSKLWDSEHEWIINLRLSQWCINTSIVCYRHITQLLLNNSFNYRRSSKFGPELLKSRSAPFFSFLFINYFHPLLFLSQKCIIIITIVHMNCAYKTLMVYQGHFRRPVNGFSVHYPKNTKIIPKNTSQS